MDGTRRRRRRRRRALETCKSLLIALLALSAVYLAVRSQLYSELSQVTPGGWLGGLVALFRQQGDSLPADTGAPGRPDVAAQAVRIAVYSGGKRFAVQYSQSQANGMYESLHGLLGEALASAKAPRQISEGEWRRALQRPGVFFDFLGRVPLEALYAWEGEGGSNPSLSGTARRVLVARTAAGDVALYYHNEIDGLYYACETAMNYADGMEDALSGYGGNGATFAFEYPSEAGYGALDPYVLIFTSAPAPRVYRGGSSLDSGDAALLEQTLRALSFRAQGGSSYPVQGGTTIREGKEILQILDVGTVAYEASEPSASRYVLEDTGVTGLIEATRKLAASTVGSLCGAGQVYLIAVEEAEQGLLVRYGYSLDGAAVRLADGGDAASFLVQDGRISAYTLRFRRYEDTGEQSLVLRERQAAAALEALSPEGRELALCYMDGGGETVQAGWVAQ